MKLIVTNPFCDPGFVERAAESALLADLVRPFLPAQHERLLILAFDDLDRLVAAEESDSCHPRTALLTPVMVRQILGSPSAASLIIAHNHPSGEASPSAHDLDLTRRIAQACTLAGLDLKDHVIITDAGHFSFRSAGLL